MNLPRFSLTHRSIILAFLVLFLVAGTFNFVTMPRREDPEITIRDALIVTPWPGASARYESTGGRWEKVALARARSAVESSTPTIPPGTIDARLCVAAQDGFVEILEIKPSSGRVMTWADYVNGRHVAPGDRFVSPGP